MPGTAECATYAMKCFLGLTFFSTGEINSEKSGKFITPHHFKICCLSSVPRSRGTREKENLCKNSFLWPHSPLIKTKRKHLPGKKLSRLSQREKLSTNFLLKTRKRPCAWFGADETDYPNPSSSVRSTIYGLLHHQAKILRSIGAQALWLTDCADNLCGSVRLITISWS